MNRPDEAKLRNFLNLYWLRPENGLLCAFKSNAFADIDFVTPSMDISCGDGFFLFLHLGGVLDSDADYFQSTHAKEFSHSSFIDIYDSYSENYEVRILRKAPIKVDYGTDWKQALLNKASKLDLYDNLLLHDNNVTPLPLPTGHFRTIYSNSIYHVSGVRSLLADIYRLLRPDGLAVLEVLTPYLLETLNQIEPIIGAEATSILDRKRRERPGGHEFREWREMMRETGFKIEDARCVYPDKLLTDIWNIGLRPISHLLIQMSDNLSDEERHRIKQEWVDIFFELFKPLLQIKQTYSLENAPYLLFILRK